MTREAMKNYAVANWGFENKYTIELFRMDEAHEDPEWMNVFIQLVDRHYRMHGA